MELKGVYSKMGWKNGKTLYSFNVTSVKITAGESRAIKVEGGHLDSRTNDDVEAFRMKDINVENFPRGLHAIFPNLIGLEIDNCDLKSICREDLNGLENLEVIHLTGNNLNSLPSDLFTNMHNLKLISFEHNEIEFLTSKLLQPIVESGLKYIDFRHNTSIDAMAVNGATLKELKKIIDTRCKVPFKEDNAAKFKNSIRAFKDLWETRLFSDLTVITGNSSVEVHKAVLGTQSSVFAAMLQNDMKESQTSEVVIEDFSAAAVEEFLKCLYTGEVQDEADAMEIFALAAKYDVLELKPVCEDLIMKNIDDLNALEVLNLAHLYGSSTALKESAFEEIQKMFPERKLPRKLMNKPEALKKIIDVKAEYEQLIEHEISRKSL